MLSPAILSELLQKERKVSLIFNNNIILKVLISCCGRRPSLVEIVTDWGCCESFGLGPQLNHCFVFVGKPLYSQKVPLGCSFVEKFFKKGDTVTSFARLTRKEGFSSALPSRLVFFRRKAVEKIYALKSFWICVFRPLEF